MGKFKGTLDNWTPKYSSRLQDLNKVKTVNYCHLLDYFKTTKRFPVYWRDVLFYHSEHIQIVKHTTHKKMSMTGCDFKRFFNTKVFDLLAWRSRRLLLLAQRVLSGLQVAVATSSRFGRRFRAPLRVLAVLQVPHCLHVAATAHPSTGDLWTFGPASTQSCPVPQRDLDDGINASVRL